MLLFNKMMYVLSDNIFNNVFLYVYMNLRSPLSLIYISKNAFFTMLQKFQTSNIKYCFKHVLKHKYK